MATGMEAWRGGVVAALNFFSGIVLVNAYAKDIISSHNGTWLGGSNSASNIGHTSHNHGNQHIMKSVPTCD